MAKTLTPEDKAQLAQLQPVQEVLRILVTALARVNPAPMPAVARMLRDATTTHELSVVAVVQLFDLADGIDMVTGVDTEH